jgi:benzil reductase ((S)-benzoin forming)
MKYAIVTGVSRGLGESTARYFLEQGIHVVGISRGANDALTGVAKENNTTYEHFSCDLGDVTAIESTCQDISEHIFKDDISTLYLVNNAAVVDPVDQSMNINSSDLAHHVQVNTIAPMTLMNTFLKKTADFAVPLVGAIVTSGAADRPVYGWSAYCTTKASMKMYIQTIALEQDTLKTDNKVIAFNPGIMDTAMQETIRSNSVEQFAEIDTFKAYKENNSLRDSDIVGASLVDILTDDMHLKNGKTYHAEDYV